MDGLTLSIHYQLIRLTEAIFGSKKGLQDYFTRIFLCPAKRKKPSRDGFLGLVNFFQPPLQNQFLGFNAIPHSQILLDFFQILPLSKN